MIGMMGPMNPWSTGGIAVHVESLARELFTEHRIRVVTPGRKSEQTSSGTIPVRVVRDFRPRPLPPIESIPEILAAVRFLRKADILHSHDPRLSSVSRLLQKPLVTTFHGYLPRELLANSGGKADIRYNLYEEAVFKSVARSDSCIAVDERIATWLREKYSASPICVPNGVDSDIFRPNGEEQPLPTILVAKHFAKKCGIEYVVRAMPEILRYVPDAVLILTGPGGEEANILRLIRDLGLTRSVFVHGKIPHDKMPSVISRSWVCAVPSIPVAGVEEATSLFALEAMACSKAVVASDIGGLKSLIRDGETGLLVEPANVTALASAIVTLLLDRGMATTLGAAARKHVVAEHSWARVAQRVSAIYEGLM